MTTQKPRAADKGGVLHVYKIDKDQRLVFGWASVAARVDGEIITDYQDDVIDVYDLENAAYEYVLHYGDAGEMHERGYVGRLVESVIFTPEKKALMGLEADSVPDGWWVGFKIFDDEVWAKIKDGTYSMFSIEGTAVREEMR